jgi:hypothetical protein
MGQHVRKVPIGDITPCSGYIRSKRRNLCGEKRMAGRSHAAFCKTLETLHMMAMIFLDFSLRQEAEHPVEQASKREHFFRYQFFLVRIQRSECTGRMESLGLHPDLTFLNQALGEYLGRSR